MLFGLDLILGDSVLLGNHCFFLWAALGDLDSRRDWGWGIISFSTFRIECIPYLTLLDIRQHEHRIIALLNILLEYGILMAHKDIPQILEQRLDILHQVQLIPPKVLPDNLQLPYVVPKKLNILLIVVLLPLVVLLILRCYILLEVTDLLVDLLDLRIYPELREGNFFRFCSLASFVWRPFLHSRMYLVFYYF